LEKCQTLKKSLNMILNNRKPFCALGLDHNFIKLSIAPPH
jgi:hypothetical protein